MDRYLNIAYAHPAARVPLYTCVCAHLHDPTSRTMAAAIASALNPAAAFSRTCAARAVEHPTIPAALLARDSHAAPGRQIYKQPKRRTLRIGVCHTTRCRDGIQMRSKSQHAPANPALEATAHHASDAVDARVEIEQSVAPEQDELVIGRQLKHAHVRVHGHEVPVPALRGTRMRHQHARALQWSAPAARTVTAISGSRDVL